MSGLKMYRLWCNPNSNTLTTTQNYLAAVLWFHSLSIISHDSVEFKIHKLPWPRVSRSTNIQYFTNILPERELFMSLLFLNLRARP
jgi:hypothetical protein